MNQELPSECSPNIQSNTDRHENKQKYNFGIIFIPHKNKRIDSIHNLRRMNNLTVVLLDLILRENFHVFSHKFQHHKDLKFHLLITFFFHRLNNHGIHSDNFLELFNRLFDIRFYFITKINRYQYQPFQTMKTKKIKCLRLISLANLRFFHIHDDQTNSFHINNETFSKQTETLNNSMETDNHSARVTESSQTSKIKTEFQLTLKVMVSRSSSSQNYFICCIP